MCDIYKHISKIRIASVQLASYEERVLDRRSLAVEHLHDHNVVPREHAGWNCQLSAPTCVGIRSGVVPAVHVAYALGVLLSPSIH